MTLSRLERDWDSLGRSDPMWAICSAERKRGGRWDAEALFESGRAEIADLLAQLIRSGHTLRMRRALDFGCGIGRLTQALCQVFERCDGVDIAQSMVEQARAANRFGDRCRYHHNRRRDLRLFEDDGFDFALSIVVLQHMQPRYALSYVREFVRVVRPGGLAVFQVPGTRKEFPPAGAPALSHTRPLAPAAFRAALSLRAEPPVEARGGGVLALPIEVANQSAVAWRPHGDTRGWHQVKLGSRWYAAGRQQALGDCEGRAELETPLPPGHTRRLELEVPVPAAAGDYTLEIDLVQEFVAWFGERGSAPLRIPLRVQVGRGPEPASRDAAAHPPREAPPKATAHEAEPLESSGGTPEAGKTDEGSAPIEMHAIPEEDIRRAVELQGGEIAEIREDQLAGDAFSSSTYVVAKPEVPPRAGSSLRRTRRRDV